MNLDVTVDVFDLHGRALDCAVALAMGHDDWDGDTPLTWFVDAHDNAIEQVPFEPSSLWRDGGPLLALEGISVEPSGNPKAPWRAQGKRGVQTQRAPQLGATYLEAGMRCLVEAYGGPRVQLPSSVVR
jgi:hypothetical protein